MDRPQATTGVWTAGPGAAGPGAGQPQDRLCPRSSPVPVSTAASFGTYRARHHSSGMENEAQGGDLALLGPRSR